MADLTTEQIVDWLTNYLEVKYNNYHEQLFYIIKLPNEWWNITNKVYNIIIDTFNKPFISMLVKPNDRLEIKAYVPKFNVQQLNAIQWCKCVAEICNGKAGGSKDGHKAQGQAPDILFLNQGVELATTLANANFK